jgi:hypothetical protein
VRGIPSRRDKKFRRRRREFLKPRQNAQQIPEVRIRDYTARPSTAQAEQLPDQPKLQLQIQRSRPGASLQLTGHANVCNGWKAASSDVNGTDFEAELTVFVNFRV